MDTSMGLDHPHLSPNRSWSRSSDSRQIHSTLALSKPSNHSCIVSCDMCHRTSCSGITAIDLNFPYRNWNSTRLDACFSTSLLVLSLNFDCLCSSCSRSAVCFGSSSCMQLLFMPHWYLGTCSLKSRDTSLFSLIGASCLIWLENGPNSILIVILIMPGRNARFLINNRTEISSWGPIRVAVRAARFGLVLCRDGVELLRLISEDESETDELPIFISLEHIVLRSCILPHGQTHTAGTLEIFFDCLILVADIRMGWSASLFGRQCRSSLIILANCGHATGSPCLIPLSAREMKIILVLATTNSNVRCTLFTSKTMFLSLS